MRELKFRAWDTEYKRWVTDRYGLFLSGELIKYDRKAGESDELVFRASGVYNNGFDNIVIMQFTGLLDKNGKEIYEGDVLTIEAEDGIINKFVVRFGIVRRDMSSGWTVDIPSFYFDLIRGNFKAFPIVKNYKGVHDLTMLKIIGNIYENENLLQEVPHAKE